MADFKYDLALSLLADDEQLAAEICRLLPESMSVFFYPERQLDLIGNDGVEEFSAVFSRDSRSVAVLYRGGWGKTKWTVIEESAIKGRLWNQGPDFVTLVKLDRELPPVWFPMVRIWADIERLGIQGVAAVLAERVQALGGTVLEETATELAARVERERAAEARRRALLTSDEGVREAERTAAALLDEFERLAPVIGAAPTRASGGISQSVMLYRDGFSVTVNWTAPYANTLDKSVLSVTEWRGRPSVGASRFYSEPQELESHPFDFDQPLPGDSVWCDRRTKRRFSSSQLADWAARLLLQRVRSASQ